MERTFGRPIAADDQSDLLCAQRPSGRRTTPGGHVWVSVSARLCFWRGGWTAATWCTPIGVTAPGCEVVPCRVSLFVMAVRLLLPLVVLVGACAPRLTPPYRDFRVASPDSSLTERLREAATEAGWTLAPPPAVAVVATAPREIGGGVSPTTAVVEMVPVSGDVVRVWVRGESRGVLGGRTKLYALTPSLRERMLGDLSAALSARGLRALDTPRDRDEAATDG